MSQRNRWKTPEEKGRITQWLLDACLLSGLGLAAPGCLLLVRAPDEDSDSYRANNDCDDLDPSINSGVTEICDGIDNDCDSAVDDDDSGVDPASFSPWYPDGDGDGWGDSEVSLQACAAPVDGWVAQSGDCNDGAAAVNPDADEICDGIDQNCDGVVDNDAVDAGYWYTDADGDGYGDDATGVRSCESVDGRVDAGGDCDDSDAAYHPGADEDCTDPHDYNCDGSTGYEDNDGDGVAACLDCDDGDPYINPGVEEVCDGIDNNCDGDVDGAGSIDEVLWYRDYDEDGYGRSDVSMSACDEPVGYVADSNDCDDINASVNPAATESCNGYDDDCDGATDEAGSVGESTWYKDSDGDGFGDPVLILSVSACDEPDGHVADSTDCDDTNVDVKPSATETCNGYDDDCDGEIDEAGSTGESTWYEDSDGDGYGDPAVSVGACTAPEHYVAADADCDDTEILVNPAGTESCNGVDDNCDGEIDEKDAIDASTWYADSDGDGNGDPGAAQTSCYAATGYVSDSSDCDDTLPDVYPGAPEYCDTIDQDCDDLTRDDESVDASTWYRDSDGDRYGDTASTKVACDRPSGYLSTSGDCDDSDDAINPGATELCDGVDNDCDDIVDGDDAADALTWHADADGDSFGDRDSTTTACDEPSGYTDNTLDCDDSDAAIYPDAPAGGVKGDATGWPRIGALWLDWPAGTTPHWCQAASYTLVMDGGVLGDLTSAWSDDEATAEGASALLHDLNPSLVLLQNALGTEYLPGGPIDPEGVASCWSDADDNLYDMDGNLVKTWSATLDIVDITDPSVRACVEAYNVAQFVAGSAIYDGLFLVSSNTSAGNIEVDDSGDPVFYDWDGDGIADSDASVNLVWAEAVIAFVQEMAEDSTLSAADVPIHTSGFAGIGAREPMWGYADGIVQPDHWTLAYEDSATGVTSKDYWLQTLYNERTQADHMSGVSLALMEGETSITDSTAPGDADPAVYTDVLDDYQRMRYGLCSALMAGMAYSYEWGQGGHGQGWWYDEYDNAGVGVGYLGQPMDEAQPVSAGTGTELITNGKLNKSLSLWGSYTCDKGTYPDDCTYTYDNTFAWDSTEDAKDLSTSGSLHLTVSQLEDSDDFIWDVILYQDGLTATADTDYVLRFSARAENTADPDKAIRGIQPYLQNLSTDSSGTVYGVANYFPVVYADDTWRTFTVPLSTAGLFTSSSTTRLRLAFAFGNHDGDVWIDNISLQPGTVSDTWYREFDNGLVLLNAGISAEPVALADIDPSETWARIDGTQDTGVNDGDTGVVEQDVPAMDGRILLKK